MNARIEAAATALLRMFELQSPRAVSLSPLAMATAAIAAADAIDPLRSPALTSTRNVVYGNPAVTIHEGGKVTVIHEPTTEATP